MIRASDNGYVLIGATGGSLDDRPNLWRQQGKDILVIKTEPYSFIPMGLSGSGTTPDKIELMTAPNPFNSVCNVEFTLRENNDVTIDVLNITGQLVETLHNGSLSVGKHHFVWTGNNHPSGIYLIRLTIGDQVVTKRAVLLR